MFKDIYVKYLENNLIFSNERGDVLDLNYINEVLDVSITIEDDIEKPTMNTGVFLLNMLVVIFKAKRVVIYDNIPINLQKEIETSMKKLMQTGLDLRVFFANGAKPVL